MKPFDIMNWFWRKYRAYSMDADAAAIFWFLLQHCNEAEWKKNPFELRIVDITTPLQISEDSFHKARKALMEAEVIATAPQAGRGKGYIFYLFCFPVQPKCEPLYNILYPTEANSLQAAQNSDSLTSNSRNQEKGQLKGGEKEELKGQQKGVKNNPFSQDFSPPFSTPFSQGFSQDFSNDKTAENLASGENFDEETSTQNYTQNMGGNKEEEKEEDILQPLYAHEETDAIQSLKPSPRAVNRPKSLDEVIRYADQLRQMQGKVQATPMLAEKFFDYYDTAKPPWHFVNKENELVPVTDWQKRFRDWEMNERSNVTRKPSYSLNVADIPMQLRGIPNFNDVWSDYLDQCTRSDRSHDRTSAVYALEYLVQCQQQGEKPIEILQTAIRNQNKEFWHGNRNNNGSRNESAQRTASTHSSRGRRKPSPTTTNSGEPPEEAFEIS